MSAGAPTSSGKRRAASPRAAAGPDLSDLLDAAGARPNPFNGLPVDAGAQGAVLARTPWNTFRMYTEGAPQLYRSLGSNDVTVLSSGTGSGKTVIAPKVAHVWAKHRAEASGSRPGPGASPEVGGGAPGGISRAVAVTNPKRLTTLKNAEFGARIAHVRLGGEVGYHFRGAPKDASSASTQLEYATDGWLLRRARDDPGMSRYAVVVIDEVHERPVPTDFLLLATRNAISRRRAGGDPLRLVVMSATLDAGLFVGHFRAAGLSVGLVEVGGKPNFPIARLHRPLPAGDDDYLRAAVRHVVDIHSDPASRPGAVLVFVPVKKDARRGCRLLGRECARRGLGEGCVSVVDAALNSEAAERAADDGSLEAACLSLFANSVAERGAGAGDARGPDKMIAAVIGARRLLPSGLLPGPQALALLAGVIFGFYLCFKEIRRVSDDLEAVRAYTLDAVSVLEANHPGGIGADRAPSGPPTAKAPPPDPAGPGPASADGREELLLREFAAGPDEDFVHVRDPSLRRLLFDDDAQGTEGAEEENVSSRGDAAEGAPGGTPEGAPEATPGEEQEEEEEEELGAEGAPGTPPDLDSLGVAALREELAGLGASFPAASKKADLRRLLAEARAASP